MSSSSSYNNPHVSLSIVQNDSNVVAAVVFNVFDLWHYKLGYPSSSIVQSFMQICKISRINKMDLSFCSSGFAGKIHKVLFPTHFLIEYTTPRQLDHIDIWGPTLYVSSLGY